MKRMSLWTLCVALAGPSLTQAANATFSSVYVDLRKDCKEETDPEGQGDPAFLCPSVGKYKIQVNTSACGALVTIEGPSGFELDLPQQSYGDTMKRKIEWRLAGGKPFAVIYRVSKYQGPIDDNIPCHMGKKVGEVLWVKGLTRVSDLEEEIPANQPDAHSRARQAADRSYH